MSKILVKQTKELIDQIPPQKLKLVKQFLQLLNEDALNEAEWDKIYQGEEQLKKGQSVQWRDIAYPVSSNN